MRIRIIQRPRTTSIDGIRLDRFEPGYQYEVGSALGALLLAEGWAKPVAIEEPGLVIPLSETDDLSASPRQPDANAPANLIREHYPPYLDERFPLAANLERRRKPRR
jgi:hypothetical protein